LTQEEASDLGLMTDDSDYEEAKSSATIEPEAPAVESDTWEVIDG